MAASIVGIGNEFAHDDLHLIVGNPRIRELGDIRQIVGAPYWPPPFSQDLWRPLTSLLLALQLAIGGEDPLLFRLVSYLGYAACSAALFVVARRFVAAWAALVAAIVFAAHPVHVEAVALAVGQSEIAVGVLALLCVMRYVDGRDRGALTARDWTLIALMYAAAVLFKENGIVIPALLIAAEILLVRDKHPGSRRSLALGVALLAAIAALLLALRFAVLGDVAGSFTAEALEGLSPGERLLTMLAVVPHWLRLMVWPLHLRLDYSPSEFTASTTFGAAELLGALILCASVAAIILLRRRAPLVSFGIAWWLIALLPVSNVLIPSGVLLAERTLFLPSIGFALALAGGLTLPLASGLALLPGDARATWRRVSVAGAVVIVFALLLRSAERQRVWRNDAFLSVRSVQNSPQSFRARRAYADVLFALNRPMEARAAYDTAVALAPDAHRWRVWNDLARQARARGEHQLEAEALRRSLAVRPDQDDARGYLVAALLQNGDYDAAAREAGVALERGGRPDVFAALRSLADSARAAGAPRGSVRVGINVAPSR